MHNVQKGEAMSDKKYTFINMKRCNGKNGEYVGVTLEAIVTKPPKQRKSPTGKDIVSFQTPVNNRGNYIKSMCGKQPYESDDGTSWARVSFWGDPNDNHNLARRFSDFIAKHPRCALMVTGAISVKESTDNKSGKTYINLDITGDDFFFVRDIQKKEYSSSSSEPNQQKAASASAAAAAAQQDNTSGFPFYDIDDDDSDLPF